ncbi:hypothetical protein WJX84_003600 [Apatococcus fuscideae]|uniref:Uncharacterized protein n=1 Tax=Apatococcus fuscideae TaxID=2026836 RepID=A0AAW1TE13_9CHLO
MDDMISPKTHVRNWDPPAALVEEVAHQYNIRYEGDIGPVPMRVKPSKLAVVEYLHTARALYVKYQATDAARTEQPFLNRLQKTIEAIFPEAKVSTQQQQELSATFLACWGLDVARNADHASFKGLMSLMAALHGWELTAQRLLMLFILIGKWQVDHKMKALWFMACFGETFLSRVAPGPLFVKTVLRAAHSGLKAELFTICLMQLAMYMAAAIGWEETAETLFMTDPDSFRMACCEDWRSMNEAELRLVLREHDLEPAIGFWYQECRVAPPEAKALAAIPKDSLASRISYKDLFIKPPNQVAGTFLTNVIHLGWPFLEAPCPQLMYFLRLCTHRFDRISLGFLGITIPPVFIKNSIASNDPAIEAELDVVLARLDTTEMWKQCEATEQLAAEKRQRKNAARRAKQSAAAQPGVGTSAVSSMHKRKPSLLMYIEQLDGNLVVAIDRVAEVTAMLDKKIATIPQPGSRIALLEATYKHARTFQTEFRRRRLELHQEWIRCQRALIVVEWRLAGQQAPDHWSGHHLEDEARRLAGVRTGVGFSQGWKALTEVVSDGRHVAFNSTELADLIDHIKNLSVRRSQDPEVEDKAQSFAFDAVASCPDTGSTLDIAPAAENAALAGPETTGADCDSIASGWTSAVHDPEALQHVAEGLDLMLFDVGLELSLGYPSMLLPRTGRPRTSGTRPGLVNVERERTGSMYRGWFTQPARHAFTQRSTLMPLHVRLQCTLGLGGHTAVLAYALTGRSSRPIQSPVATYRHFLQSHRPIPLDHDTQLRWEDCHQDLICMALDEGESRREDWGRLQFLYDQLCAREEQTARMLQDAMPRTPQMDLRFSLAERERLHQDIVLRFLSHVQVWCTQGLYKDGGSPSQTKVAEATFDARFQVLHGYRSQAERGMAFGQLWPEVAGEYPKPVEETLETKQDEAGKQKAQQQLLDMDWSSAIASGRPLSGTPPKKSKGKSDGNESVQPAVDEINLRPLALTPLKHTARDQVHEEDPRRRSFTSMQAELRAACQPPAEVSSLRAAVKHVVAWLGLHASLVQAPQLQEMKELLQQAKTVLRRSSSLPSPAVEDQVRPGTPAAVGCIVMHDR